MDKVNIYNILTDLGYKLKDYGKEYRTRPIYRDSDNDTVLRIYKDTGCWFDFKENTSGDFNSLIGITLNMNDPAKANEWLKSKNFDFLNKTKENRPLIKGVKKFDKNIIEELKPDHSYWLKRGVKEEVISEFKGGVALSGKMKDRYVFPVFNHRSEIIGLSGRTTTEKSKIKWKHLGDKSAWCYPLFLSLDDIKRTGRVYLVESIGDCLSLRQAGIANVIVTFGLDVSISILNLLLKLNLNNITISFNNDSNKNNAGNFAAEKIYKKLKRYFDINQLEIKLPTRKDFGEMTSKEIQEWL